VALQLQRREEKEGKWTVKIQEYPFHKSMGVLVN
jgi:hypothetical protein